MAKRNDEIQIFVRALKRAMSEKDFRVFRFRHGPGTTQFLSAETKNFHVNIELIQALGFLLSCNVNAFLRIGNNDLTLVISDVTNAALKNLVRQLIKRTSVKDIETPAIDSPNKQKVIEAFRQYGDR